MSKFFVWAWLAVGCLTIIAYLAHGLKSGRKWSSEDATSILGSCIGIASALQVCIVTVVHWDEPPITGICAQMFFGGVATALIAGGAIVKKFKG